MINPAIFPIDHVDNLFSPVLVFLSFPEIKDNEVLFVLIEVLDLIGDDPDGDLSQIYEEVVLVMVLVYEKIHVIVFEDAVKSQFLYLTVGHLAEPAEIVLLLYVADPGLNEIAHLLLILAENVETVFHLGQQELRNGDPDLVDTDPTDEFVLFVTDGAGQVGSLHRHVHETAERFNHRYDLLLRESFYLVETLLVLVELQPVVKKMDA